MEEVPAVAVQESFLRCTVCEREAEHEVVYAGRFVTQIVCTGCGAVTRLDVSEDYLPDLADRISTKPRRLAGLFRDDPATSVTSFPGRLLSKPLRMVGEFRDVWAGRTRRR